MITKQPQWKCIGQLGDASPTEYGGYWIFVDETGVYPPEAELLAIHDDDGEAIGALAYRFALENCTYINGILSDNKFHPDYPAWFATPEDKRRKRPQDTTYLRNVACFHDIPSGDIIAQLISTNPLLRAEAWRAIGEYHGFENLDSYPLQLSIDDIEKRYSAKRYEVK